MTQGGEAKINSYSFDWPLSPCGVRGPIYTWSEVFRTVSSLSVPYEGFTAVSPQIQDPDFICRMSYVRTRIDFSHEFYNRFSFTCYVVRGWPVVNRGRNVRLTIRSLIGHRRTLIQVRQSRRWSRNQILLYLSTVYPPIRISYCASTDCRLLPGSLLHSTTLLPYRPRSTTIATRGLYV